MSSYLPSRLPLQVGLKQPRFRGTPGTSQTLRPTARMPRGSPPQLSSCWPWRFPGLPGGLGCEQPIFWSQIPISSRGLSHNSQHYDSIFQRLGLQYHIPQIDLNMMLVVMPASMLSWRWVESRSTHLQVGALSFW